MGRLLESALNGGERRIEVGAEALHHGDNRNRDPCGNEAVFDRGRTLFVSGKFPEKIDHWIGPFRA